MANTNTAAREGMKTIQLPTQRKRIIVTVVLDYDADASFPGERRKREY